MPGNPREFLAVFRYSRRALELVWRTSRPLTVVLAVFTLLAGVLPAAVAWVGALIIDAVVAAAGVYRETGMLEARPVMVLVAVEGALVGALAGAQRALSASQSLLRAQLGQRVNEMILQKALQLDLAQFEDAEFYDKLTRARREASSRPLSLVTRTFGLAQNGISLVSYGVLLAQFSGWAVLLLVLAGLPSFLAEAKFSGDAFRLFRWRSPETRMQMYLETVLAREDHAKEVQLFTLGPRLLDRYREIFRKLYREDRNLTLRRDGWGFVFGLVGTVTLYGAYAWVAFTTIAGRITLGQMTMYMMLFRQGQAAVSASLSAISGMYEDNLYLSTLYEYLETPVAPRTGELLRGPDPSDGIRFEQVSFTYPGAETPALRDIDLHIKPGESLALVGENGAGKTTLVKLLARLYDPTEGRILVDGTDLRNIELHSLRRNIGIIFQDYIRFQLRAKENIAVGNIDKLAEQLTIEEAAQKSMADEVIDTLPERYEQFLGKRFKDGVDLSGGQWQKVALGRAYMRDAQLLILDEPTSALDARAEHEVFLRFSELIAGKTAVLISHRFSTVRMADRILFLENGQLLELGSHEELLAKGGKYAELFQLQAQGYL